jgi:glutamine amidotransferase
MCRHLAYLGPPRTLASLLYDPPQSLVRQSWAPRNQRYGTVNADGYGVGWYQPDVSPEPGRFRRAGPIWADRSLESLARVVRSGAFLAAVRSATPPAPIEETGAAPFTDGPWLFSLNGRVNCDLDALRGQVSPRRRATILGTSDAELLFALLLDRLDGGSPPAKALAGLVGDAPGRLNRLNLLLTDGATIWATTWGDSLSWRPWGAPRSERAGPSPSRPSGSSGDALGSPGELGPGVVVASEPLDDEPGWVAVPDCSLLTATADSTSVVPLPTAAARDDEQGAPAP